MKQSILVMLVILVAGCTWVKETEGAKDVALVKSVHAVGCQKIGHTKSTVKDTIGIIERGERKVSNELITLAKNDAASRGGNSIVATSGIVDGSQTFDIHHCEMNSFKP